MKENSIAISLLVQGLRDSSLEQKQRALLEAYQEDLLRLFQNTGSPSRRWVAEIVALAITESEGQYRKILDNYLMFLQKEGRIVEEYHIQGLADILSLAQNPNWMTASHGEQILSLLLNEKKNRLLNPANKDVTERYQCLSLWQQVLFVLTDVGTEIQDGQKDSLRHSFKAYETSFRSKDGDDEMGLSLVALAQQSLLHVKDDSAPLWKRAGMKALSATKNLTLSAAALGTLPVTFGLSSLGAIAPTAAAINDIAALVKDIYRHIKEKKDTKEWYQELLTLRSLFILSIYYQEETQFKNLVNGFIHLPDKQLKLSLANGLLDTVKQILISWPGETYKKYHEQCYLFVQDCLNNLDDKALVTRLFTASMELMKESSVNESFIALWVEYIAKNESLFTHLPLTADFIKSMGIFYQTLARIKQQSNNDPAAQLKWTELQKILVSRLVAGCTSENNVACLETLCLLELDESIEDKKPVNHGLAVIQAQMNDKLEHARQDAKRQIQIENTQPSLMLIEWAYLSEEKQHILAAIFNRYGVDILVDASSKKSPALFREVKNLIIVLYVGKNAIHVEDLPETDGGRKTLQMLLDWKDRQAEKGAQDTPQFAEKVRFAFVAHYVDGFKQGVNKSLVQEALRLARELGAGQKLSSALQDHLARASLAGSSSVAIPYRPSVAPKDTDKTDVLAEENVDWIKPERVGNRYVVKIHYDEGLSKDEAIALQELLQGKSGIKAATQKGECKTDEDGDYIIEMPFSSEKSASNLTAQAKELITQMRLQSQKEFGLGNR